MASSLVVEGALQALDAAQLRELIHHTLAWLDPALSARLETDLLERASRGANAWTPESPGEKGAASAEAFVAAASKVGYAEPHDVDDVLQRGVQAFLARDYRAATRIFGAVLGALGQAMFHIGEDELVDELLGVDSSECAHKFAVATYMDHREAPAEERAAAVLLAIQSLGGIGYFFRPLKALEEAAIEPLPEFDAFLESWRTLVEAGAETRRRGGWDRSEGEWLREVTLRLHGEEGLAEVARRSRAYNDYNAWCRLLKERKDWAAARAAYEGAAERVEADPPFRGELFDGAALAAQELGAADLSEVLERAWKVAPTLERLLRWLGQSATREELVARAEQALAAAQPRAERQRAVLLVLASKFDEAARLLEEAEGIGWSHEHHPGPVIFDVFAALLAGEEVRVKLPDSGWALRASRVGDAPTLKTPELNTVLAMAGLEAPEEPAMCEVMRVAMRKAAEVRVDEVAEHKHRKAYSHAAGLVVRCAGGESTPEAEAWMRGIMEKYRRFSSLKKAFREAGA